MTTRARSPGDWHLVLGPPQEGRGVLQVHEPVPGARTSRSLLQQASRPRVMDVFAAGGRLRPKTDSAL